jgi:hypothetical protein
VLQRNTTSSPWTFTDEPVRQVLPGETTDHPVLLDGWTAVQDEQPEPKTTAKKRPAAADTEGGEPQ